jgi:hypothetical protein
VGIEAEYYFLGQRQDVFDQYPRNDQVIISRPFFDINPRNPNTGVPLNIPGQQAAELVSFPNVLFGRVTVDYHDYFDSAGIWGRYNLYCCDPCNSCDPCDPCNAPTRRVDLIAGYRYYRLSDSVEIREDLVSGPAGTVPRTGFFIEDSFRARNEFHGGEIGLISQIASGRWTFELLTKVALGNTHQEMVINGLTIERAPNGQQTRFNNLGILAGPSNVGTYTRDEFAAIPQIGLDAGYNWNRHVKTFLGYNLVYWGTVLRAGEQIDLRVDTGNFPQPITPSLPFPSFLGQTNSFWAQGLNLGMELQY